MKAKFILKGISAAFILIGMSPCAFADGKDPEFSENKQHIVKGLSEDISALQTAKSCVSSASDREALKACMDALEKTRRQRRAENIDEKIRKLQEEKAKLGAPAPKE